MPSDTTSSHAVGPSSNVIDNDIPTLNKVLNNTSSAVNMASTYFTLPSFTRAKKNQEELRKSNPQVPILKDEDEKFLERTLSQDDSTPQANSVDVKPTVISDNGQVNDAQSKDIEAAAASGSDQVVVPETRPDTAADNATDATDTQPKKAKKKKDFDLPSQEEAEAATRNWDAAFAKNSAAKDTAGDKRTWASYLPSIPTVGKKDGKGPAQDDSKKTDEADKDARTENKSVTTDGASTPSRTWTEYASSYVPASLPTLPTIPTKWNFKSKDKDSQFQPVHNADGSINEKETKDQQEKEITILLDNMSATTLNDRVFALNAQTQKIYEDFALALKDTINGTPTAYQDMEKLMREAGPRLEEQFKALPPFMQTLVKSLPAKLGTVLAPELLAAAADKPGADLKAQQASSSGATTPPRGAAGAKSKAKSKRKVPGLKSLIGQQGAVAGILRNVVKFLQVRFPFLASATNVVMSLSVFILMFVFWYCHKRGKEIRLEQEKSAAEVEEVEDDDDDDDEEEESAEEDELNTAAGEKLGEAKSEGDETTKQPEPSQVPLPA